MLLVASSLLLGLLYAMTLNISREVKSLHKTLKQSKAESNKRNAKLYANMFAPSKVSLLCPLVFKIIRQKLHSIVILKVVMIF